MANRSYLYAAEALPSDTDIPKDIRCISEFKSSVPLVHQLLVGSDTRVLPSMIWDRPICLGGAYRPAADLVIRLLAKVGEGGLAGTPDFDRMVASTTEFLGKGGEWFLLEVGEILELGGDIDDGFAYERSNVTSSWAAAEAALAGTNDGWLAGVRANWQQHFDCFYSEHLYYTFTTR